jgi:hypothetical protein
VKRNFWRRFVVVDACFNPTGTDPPSGDFLGHCACGRGVDSARDGGHFGGIREGRADGCAGTVILQPLDGYRLSEDHASAFRPSPSSSPMVANSICSIFANASASDNLTASKNARCP